ncbi:unnamed protein product [Protopolystoma xenopodis]|uniref:Uncharacterized protein n=1 Tax=Protopolystoma xenopodis TaxID=117903 RepID=A0A448WWC6_9PLAT|nr:unnamed protein product [Protopolystoma xenopodis]
MSRRPGQASEIYFQDKLPVLPKPSAVPAATTVLLDRPPSSGPRQMAPAVAQSVLRLADVRRLETPEPREFAQLVCLTEALTTCESSVVSPS